MSRQAARQRFDGIVPRVPPHQRADHQSQGTLQERHFQVMQRQMQAGTWRRDHGEDEVVPW